ncbi:MAG: hypothetical protein ACHQJ6_03200 [Candidatus Berkiellales bacterium]
MLTNSPLKTRVSVQCENFSDSFLSTFSCDARTAGIMLGNIYRKLEEGLDPPLTIDEIKELNEALESVNPIFTYPDHPDRQDTIRALWRTITKKCTEDEILPFNSLIYKMITDPKYFNLLTTDDLLFYKSQEDWRFIEEFEQRYYRELTIAMIRNHLKTQGAEDPFDSFNYQALRGATADQNPLTSFLLHVDVPIEPIARLGMDFHTIAGLMLEDFKGCDLYDPISTRFAVKHPSLAVPVIQQVQQRVEVFPTPAQQQQQIAANISNIQAAHGIAQQPLSFQPVNQANPMGGDLARPWYKKWAVPLVLGGSYVAYKGAQFLSAKAIVPATAMAVTAVKATAAVAVPVIAPAILPAAGAAVAVGSVLYGYKKYKERRIPITPASVQQENLLPLVSIQPRVS